MTGRAAWAGEIQRLYPQLLVNPLAMMIYRLAEKVMTEQQATIARMRAELDNYQGRSVLHCTEAQMDTAALAALDEPDGTILRATDTGTELVLRDHTWLPR
jgi:hypothetical protein